MNYNLQYELLVKCFSTKQKCIQIDDLSTKIVNCPFDSTFSRIADSHEWFPTAMKFDQEITRNKIQQNDSFSYPVIFSGKAEKSDQAILFLHGLNERSWNKYLVWAKYLSDQTGQPVILFPLAFHMNRAPEKWNDARAMSPLVSDRRKHYSDLKDSTYLNAALSIRIENYPEQFVISGMQSYMDIIRIVSSILEGKHFLFRKNTKINIFSYSIGAFLSELIMMDNPERLFDSSKLCLFCGGATFDHLNGASRYIMDSRAFQKLHALTSMSNFKCLRRYFENSGISGFKHTLETLRYMTFFKEGKLARERILNQIGERIYAIGLSNDQVVPPLAILQTLKGDSMNLPTKVEIMDFPYLYTHEIPFPINNKLIGSQVDSCFKEVFDKVAGFLK